MIVPPLASLGIILPVMLSRLALVTFVMIQVMFRMKILYSRSIHYTKHFMIGSMVSEEMDYLLLQ